MLELRCKVKGNAGPQGKPRVYFTCHSSDFEKSFEKMSQDIFQAQDCAIYYTANMAEPISQEDRELQLRRMNLFVIPVSLKLLIDSNRAMDEDFAFAVKEHIPVLPVVIEPGLDPIYSREDRFGDRNYLLAYGGADKSGLTYEEKLRKYLNAVLIDDKTADRVRAAFDCYVFLSYRKKDRKYADELMRLIHRNPVCRDIAIWYDEYLTPGEGFNEAIAKMLDKSRLYTLLVTPNLINEENYVHTTEYPAARRTGKPIFPAEMESTDRAILEQRFEGLPVCSTYEDENAFYAEFLNALQGVALRENDNDPTHNYLIGLAYLDGIDVEVDRERALTLITIAANSNLAEAIQKLYELYRDGNSVPQDYRSALLWAERLVDVLKSEEGEEAPKTLIAIKNLALASYNLGQQKEARELLEHVYVLYGKVFGEDHQETLTVLSILAEICYLMGDNSRALELYNNLYVLRCKVLGKNHTNSLEALSRLAHIFGELGDNNLEAELQEKVYALSCEVLGEEHPDTLSALSYLAESIDMLGDSKRAVKMKETVFYMRRKVLGEEDPLTLIALGELAGSIGKMGDKKRAIALLDKTCYSICDEKQADKLIALSWLTTKYYWLGDEGKALALAKRAFALCCKAGDEEILKLPMAFSSLVLTCRLIGDYKTAMEIRKKEYPLLCKVYGEDAQISVSALNDMAQFCGKLGDYKQEQEFKSKLSLLKGNSF